MQITPARTAAKQQVKQAQDNATANSKMQTSVGGANSHQGINVAMSEQQKLMLGAKALMASLNKQLSLANPVIFTSYTNESVTVRGGQPTKLDKLNEIVAEPLVFDFELVAEQVMDFVSGAIMNAQTSDAGDDRLRQMLSQARSGVEQGFSAARQVLKSFEIYTPDITTGIDKSYALISDSIDELEHQIFSPRSSGDTLGGIVDSSGGSISLHNQERATISVTSHDGDNIDIHFGKLGNVSQQQIINPDIASHRFKLNNNESFSFQIEGQLGKDESLAVTKLIKNISKLAAIFFDARPEKAWRQAEQLGFNEQQIAKLSLEFKDVKQLAVREHYTQGASQPESPIATLSPYLKNLNSLLDQAKPLLSIDDLTQLMDAIAIEQLELTNRQVQQYQQSFSDFNRGLIDALS